MTKQRSLDHAPHDISSDIADWSREQPFRFWDPGRKLIQAVRLYQAGLVRGGLIGTIRSKVAVQSHQFWSVVTGADISLNCEIGGGLRSPHLNGIVIHDSIRIGVSCLIFHQVTLGSCGHGGVPEISGHVDDGAGAKIPGSVRFGAHAKIGANAVIMDVEEGGVAIGYNQRVHHVLDK
jgi:serine O-acetyltransferase